MSVSRVVLTAVHETLPVGAVAVETHTGRAEVNPLASNLLGPAPSPHAFVFDELFGDGALERLGQGPASIPCLFRTHHADAAHPVVDLRVGPWGPFVTCTVEPWSYAAPIDDEADSGLAHVVSHDLREPYRMVDSFLELLVGEVGEPLTPRGKRGLVFLRDATHRLGAQLEALTSHMRLDTRGQAFSAVDLRLVVHEAERLVSSDIPLEIDAPKHPFLVLGDPSQLARGLHALIDNAIKFRHTEEPRVRLDVQWCDGRVVVLVIDNGIGIPDGDHERMFRMFQQRHPRGDYPGMGMGLPLARRVAQRHGGRCWLSARPGERGTIARLSLQPAFGHDC